ncbi:hypothetical protein B0F90DRAFT_1628793, partial [Multifurca ochricompacta]
NAYKVRSFQVAIAAILEHDKPIKSGQEAIKLRGIGLGIANRIDFFLQGKEYGLEHQAKQRLLAIETFEKIPGIGQRTATNLVNEGAVSVSDLNLPKYAALLKPTQKVGVLYGEHITKPFPVQKPRKLQCSFIRDHISCNFEVHLTGAYRRESTELPEVTILLHHHLQIHVPTPSPPSPSTTATTTKVHAKVRTRGKQHVPFLQVNTSAAQRRASPLLQDVIRPLEAAGLLAAPLAPAGPRKWRGVALLPLRAHSAWQEVGDRMRDLRAGRGKYIRLNLSLAPLKSRGAAQIILTGDEEFVRIARLAAARLGMHLDEYGLWRWHTSEEAALESQTSTSTPTPTSSPSSPSTSSLSSGSGFGLPSSSSTTDTTAPTGYWELVEGESEDRILDELELGPIAPHRRNFRFLTSKKRASARAGTFDFSLAILTGKETEDDFFPKVGRPSPMREGESGADG